MAGLDMVVPGAAPVHFLFPVWDPAVDNDHSRTDVTSVVLHLQLRSSPGCGISSVSVRTR